MTQLGNSFERRVRTQWLLNSKGDHDPRQLVLNSTYLQRSIGAIIPRRPPSSPRRCSERLDDSTSPRLTVMRPFRRQTLSCTKATDRVSITSRPRGLKARTLPGNETSLNNDSSDQEGARHRGSSPHALIVNCDHCQQLRLILFI